MSKCRHGFVGPCERCHVEDPLIADVARLRAALLDASSALANAATYIQVNTDREYKAAGAEIAPSNVTANKTAAAAKKALTAASSTTSPREEDE